MKQLTGLRMGLVFLLLAGSGLLAAGDDGRCGLCGKLTDYGHFVTLGDHTWHKSCYRRAVVCKHCKQPNRGGAHKACEQQARPCGQCGGSIDAGRYLATQAGFSYHEACFQRAAKCGICQMPDPGARLYLGTRMFHQTCYQRTGHCGLCPEPLVGVYFLDDYQRKCCSLHQDGPKCSVCAWPGVAWKLKDGRHLCDRCNQSAVFDSDRAVALVTQVREALAAMGLAIQPVIHLELVSAEEIALWRGPVSAKSLGKFSYHRDGAAQAAGAPGVLTISILYGLPEALFRGVAAHELGHAWQSGHCVDDQNGEVLEGTAELISYLYLSQRVSRREAERIRTKTIEPYATGFRKAHHHYQSMGGPAFFAWVRTVRGF